jgi:thioredoxin 1
MDAVRTAKRPWTSVIYLVLLAGVWTSSGCSLTHDSDRTIAAISAPRQPLRRDPPVNPFLPLTPSPGIAGEALASSGPPAMPMPMPDGRIQPVASEALSGDPRASLIPTPASPGTTGRVDRPLAEQAGKRVVLHAGQATFDQQVLRSEVPVLVDFYASWCGPCKALAPTLEQLAAETPRARVVKVDIDDSPELAERYGVTSVPNLVVFKDGRVVTRQTGNVSKSRLKAMLDL